METLGNLQKIAPEIFWTLRLGVLGQQNAYDAGFEARNRHLKKQADLRMPGHQRTLPAVPFQEQNLGLSSNHCPVPG